MASENSVIKVVRCASKLRQAGDEHVSPHSGALVGEKPRLIEYPGTHVILGQVICYQVRRRVEVGRDKHVQDGASVRIQPCRDRMTGCRIELLFVTKSGSADVNCYAVEAACLSGEISLKSATKQGISFGIPKNRLARSKLTGLWSTTVTLLPERASIVARFPPPQPSRRTFLAWTKNASIVFTYGSRLAPAAELWL